MYVWDVIRAHKYACTAQARARAHTRTHIHVHTHARARRQTDRQTERQTDEQRNRARDRDRQRDRETETERQIDRETETETKRNQQKDKQIQRQEISETERVSHQFSVRRPPYVFYFSDTVIIDPGEAKRITVLLQKPPNGRDTPLWSLDLKKKKCLWLKHVLCGRTYENSSYVMRELQMFRVPFWTKNDQLIDGVNKLLIGIWYFSAQRQFPKGVPCGCQCQIPGGQHSDYNDYNTRVVTMIRVYDTTVVTMRRGTLIFSIFFCFFLFFSFWTVIAKCVRFPLL